MRSELYLCAEHFLFNENLLHNASTQLLQDLTQKLSKQFLIKQPDKNNTLRFRKYEYILNSKKNID